MLFQEWLAVGKFQNLHLWRTSLCLWCAEIWQTQRSVSIMLLATGYKFVTNLCQADLDHHFDFICTVSVYLQGVMKYTQHVSQDLCAAAADIIKLAWWMTAIYATKYCVCTLWNLSAQNTATPAVASSVCQLVFVCACLCLSVIDRQINR